MVAGDDALVMVHGAQQRSTRSYCCDDRLNGHVTFVLADVKDGVPVTTNLTEDRLDVQVTSSTGASDR
jgi:hypothetical protein